MAAAVGWAGATLWKQLQADGGENASRKSDAAHSASGVPPREARALAWCPACRVWFVADSGHRCETPEGPAYTGRPGA